MFTKIIVLYMTYILDLPTWCKVLMSMSLAFDLVRFGIGLHKGFTEGENECETE